MRSKNDQFSLSTLKQIFLFHKYRGQGHLMSYLKNRIQWHWYPPLGVVSKFPPHVDIEISTYCNMNCPMCYRTSQDFKGKVKPHFMEEELFRKIIDECSRHKLFSIRLSLRGESFMHPKVFDFIRLAKEKGIKEVSSLTNGLALTPDKFERLIELKFDWLTISFDGLAEVYESIRKPAKFNDALAKIKAYHFLKKKHKSLKPAVRIQTIWPAIKDNPQEFYDTFSPYVDSITSNPLIDFLREDDDIEYDSSFRCPYLYQRLVVGADGLALLCSSDEYADHIIGDVNEESIYDIWHGEKLNRARLWFSKRTKEWWKIAPCKHCCYPRKKEDGKDTFVDGRRINVSKYTKRNDRVSIK